jgi:hypothetical protein
MKLPSETDAYLQNIRFDGRRLRSPRYQIAGLRPLGGAVKRLCDANLSLDARRVCAPVHPAAAAIGSSEASQRL